MWACRTTASWSVDIVSRAGQPTEYSQIANFTPCQYRLLKLRADKLSAGRARIYAAFIEPKVRSRESTELSTKLSRNVGWSLRTWEGSAGCATLESLARYRTSDSYVTHDCSEFNGEGGSCTGGFIVPWERLKDVYRNLPTQLS